MFNDKEYFTVNREERFYCALLAHALLTSGTFRTAFSNLLNTRTEVILDPESFEIYLEAAVLRDYWNDIGDASVYSEATHRRRKEVIEEILSFQDLPSSLICENDFFWTSRNRRKLWSPGRWVPSLTDKVASKRLWKIKWAFNAKPDIMIVSNSFVLLIEAKLESEEGQDTEKGYKQFEIQQLVGRLMKQLIPSFKKFTFINIVLSKNDSKQGISWNEVLTLIEASGLDEFTQKCFCQLKRYY